MSYENLKKNTQFSFCLKKFHELEPPLIILNILSILYLENHQILPKVEYFIYKPFAGNLPGRI